MWRRLQALGPWRSAVAARRSLASLHSSSPAPSPFRNSPPLFSQQVTDADTVLAKGKKTVEDVMPIATGHEREEIEAELEGKRRFDMDAPSGPFGTKKIEYAKLKLDEMQQRTSLSQWEVE